ncbi:Ubiquitin Carboxyl-Terminal Hydrolase 43 [Manis pentadactyla]|nr:Ubiquitin Carboxyl-Terminal Hydrolase 43 [Manis pentadactyla]
MVICIPLSGLELAGAGSCLSRILAGKDGLLQALFPEVDRRSSNTAVSSLPSPVVSLVMECFSPSFHLGKAPQA